MSETVDDLKKKVGELETKIGSANKDTKCLGAPLTCILTMILVLYIISPIDLIPDVIPIIGWLDDLVAILGIIGVNSGFLFSLLRK